MSHDPMQAALTGLMIIAAAVWLGGLVTIFLVARVATRTLPPASRVVFFRGLGRVQGVIGSIALVVALSCGGALLYGRAWNGLIVATVASAAGLVCLTVVGMAQAHAMTRLRRALLRTPTDDQLTHHVRVGARRAAALRCGIAACSLALVALGAILAT